MPINLRCAVLGEPLFRYWLPAGEPQLPCPLLSCRMITTEDAKASLLPFSWLRALE